eukprot:15324457-Alexandrium_andersonii.AAC.1
MRPDSKASAGGPVSTGAASPEADSDTGARVRWANAVGAHIEAQCIEGNSYAGVSESPCGPPPWTPASSRR